MSRTFGIKRRISSPVQVSRKGGGAGGGKPLFVKRGFSAPCKNSYSLKAGEMS